jgi:hypothetical protein
MSMEDFAEGLARVVAHLAKTKGYTCIRWISITNEPGWDWSWWQEPPNKPMPLRPGLAAVRRALDRRGIAIPLSGPDWTDLPALDPHKIDFDDLIGAYDLHSYLANFDGRKGGYGLSVAEKRLAEWAGWAHARGKPLFLSELGTMCFGWGNDHPGPGSYESGIKDAELVVRALNAGVDGFNRWSLLNRGDLDGQWQLVDTWDAKNKRLLTTFTPHPNAYYLYGLLSRFTAKRSAVLSCGVQGGRDQDTQHVFAAAMRSPGGQVTLIVVNDAPADWKGAFDIRMGQSAKGPLPLYRYRITPAQRDRADVVVEPSAEFTLVAGEAKFEDRIPAESLSVYTTYRRSHGEPGVVAE